MRVYIFFFFQAEDGIRDADVTGVQTCALPICQLVPRRSRACHAGSSCPCIVIGTTTAGRNAARRPRNPGSATPITVNGRSEERRVGEEGRSRWAPYH